MAIPLTGQVNPPSNTSAPDGNPIPLLAGKQGELCAVDIHGKYYTQSYRGNVYVGSTALAGTIIPVNAANLVSTFTLWNPLGSGKNAVLASYDVGMTSATAVVANIALVVQTNVGSTTAVPGTLTALTPLNSATLQGGNNVAKLYSAATLVGTPTVLMTLAFSFGTTTVSAGPTNSHYEFDGKIIVPPGALITTVSTAAQTAAMHQTLIWEEVPI